MDPYEHAPISGYGYYGWQSENIYVPIEGVRRAAEFLQTFIQYPPSQTPASFSVDQIAAEVKRKVAQMQAAAAHQKE